MKKRPVQIGAIFRNGGGCHKPGEDVSVYEAAPLAPPRGAPVEIFGREVLAAGQEPVGCRFVHGDPAADGWRYCQGACAAGAVYCAEHRRRVLSGRLAGALMPRIDYILKGIA